jgi:hypothetical protein
VVYLSALLGCWDSKRINSVPGSSQLAPELPVKDLPSSSPRANDRDEHAGRHRDAKMVFRALSLAPLRKPGFAGVSLLVILIRRQGSPHMPPV